MTACGESAKRSDVGRKSRVCSRCVDFETPIRELYQLRPYQETEPTLGIPNRGMVTQVVELLGSPTGFRQVPRDHKQQEGRGIIGKNSVTRNQRSLC